MRYDDLLADLRSALDAGRVDEADVRRLLARSERAQRPRVAGVLRAAGAVVFLFGLALLFGVGYDGYPHAVKLAGPFVFPAIALVATVLLHRRQRPRWEVELAGMVAYVALGMAYLAAGAAADADSTYGLFASVSAVVIVAAMHAAVGIVRLTSWGLTVSLVAFTGFASDAAGFLSEGTIPWLFAAQAGVALGTGAAVLRRGAREIGANALRSAALLGLLACTYGIGDAGSGEFGGWHVALTLVVAATLVGAAALDLSGVMWIGAIGGVVWVGAIAAVVGESAGWALAVMLGGCGLVGLAVLVSRLRPAVTAHSARL
jgi:hypothetical protein